MRTSWILFAVFFLAGCAGLAPKNAPVKNKPIRFQSGVIPVAELKPVATPQSELAATPVVFNAAYYGDDSKNDYRVVFGFDGKAFADTLVYDLVALEDGKPIIKGAMQGIEGEIFCGGTGGNNTDPVVNLRCVAYRGERSVNRVIGEDIVTIPMSVYRRNVYAFLRYYPLERWPKLNPEKPFEVPAPPQTTTSAGQLMQEALTIYE